MQESKPRLTFYTNMPTPYQLDFFDALHRLFNLHVVYFTVREVDRQWNLNADQIGYKVTVLRNGWLAKAVQKKISSFHYDPEINEIINSDPAKYIVVNGTYWSPNVRIAIMKNFARGKFVAYWSEPVFPVNNRIKHLLKQFALNPVLKYTNCILAIGKKAETGYRKYTYQKPIYQLPYNINIGLFESKNLDASFIDKLKATYQNNNEYIFLSSGSLIFRKGMDTLIKAFKNVPKKHHARLLIIGDGPDRAQLEELAGSDPDILLLGFQDKEMIPYWFNLADAFVFASRYDGWGLVINEALAAKKPVIASKETGAAVDKLNDHNAFLLAAGDVDAYTHSMIRLCSEPGLASGFVEKNQHIREELSSELNAKKLYDICSNS
ncbi:glycosyltransferase family 4 protein [Flavitalea antarctica]